MLSIETSNSAAPASIKAWELFGLLSAKADIHTQPADIRLEDDWNSDSIS